VGIELLHLDARLRLKMMRLESKLDCTAEQEVRHRAVASDGLVRAVALEILARVAAKEIGRKIDVEATRMNDVVWHGG